MAYADLLIHEAEVYRRGGNVDRFKQPVGDSLVGTVKCRLTAAKGGETFADRSRDVIRATHELFLLPDADLREDDTVTVSDPDTGRVLLANANVTLVRAAYDGAEEHHREAFLLVIRGSA